MARRQLDLGLKVVQATNDVFQKANEKLSNNDFSSVDELTKYIRTELTRIG